ncbi:glycosyltransferase family 61 protein [Acuticoccus sp. M5D2P5]|uniref:glycosyltransferase family 61 protein n=1 Tax=Acuticoccus kalidii TaxID=2910977 RepID=UPI001F280C28|nr:glycosyltransferase family 61 protein [Acuticoccus kalidii]MCF3932186.1 glycosyltransferase family 61 protein [Acuticoccus kalidii]
MPKGIRGLNKASISVVPEAQRANWPRYAAEPHLDARRRVHDGAYRGHDGAVPFHVLDDVHLIYYSGPKHAFQDEPQLGRRGVAVFRADGTLLDLSTLVGRPQLFRALAANAVPLDEIVLAGDRFCDGNMCHVLVDHLVRAVEARRGFAAAPVAFYGAAWPFARALVAEVMPDALFLKEGVPYRVRRLIYADDAFGKPIAHPLLERSLATQEAIRAAITRFAIAPETPTRRIVLERRGIADARVADEGELVAALGRKGFVAVDTADLSPAHQLGLFAAADIVVGGHGAALTNLLASRSGSRVVEIKPAGRSDVYERLAKLAGAQYTAIASDAPDWLAATLAAAGPVP